MSKGDILRGFVSERLAVATQEILGVVDRIAAGWEEEASGFRREIERQRRQLEVLLQQPLTQGREGFKHSRSLDSVEEEEDTEHPEELKDSTPQTLLRREPLSGECKKRKPGRPRISETQRLVDVRIRILKNSHTSVLSNAVLKKSPIQKLKCPPGLNEGDFLELLKSSFPQLSGKDKRFDILISDERQRLRPVKLMELSPKNISGNSSGAGWEKSTLYIRLKDLQTCEEDLNINNYEVSLSDSDIKTFDKTRPQTSSPVHEVEGSSYLLRNTTSQQEREAENTYAGDYVMSEPSDSNDNHRIDAEKEEKEEEREEANNSDEDCNPDNSTEPLRASDSELGSRKQESALSCARATEKQMEDSSELGEEMEAQPQIDTRRKMHLCGECGKSLSDYRSLSRHKVTHSEERPHGCQVCGRRFKLPGTLRQHEKIHTNRERTYLCDICCKMFLTSKQLQIHLRTHSNEKPYHCGECGKGFTTKGPLTIHMRVHTGETPYCCPDCGWSFKRKPNLLNHLRIHSGQKPFVCRICGKACARKTYLTVHMRTHNGERPYKCTLCDKGFTQSHCLKSHMKSHKGAEAST